MPPPTSNSFRSSPVVAYIRSTKLHDLELEQWEAQVRAYAAENGFNLAEVLCEVGVSEIAAYRPIFERLVLGLTRGVYVGVIMPSSVHLSREPRIARHLRARIEQWGWLEFAS